MTENERVTRLEHQIKRLEEKQAELYEQLAQARLDQWKGRLEDLEVQMRLGSMETTDRVTALVQRARQAWDDAEARFGGAAAAAPELLESVRAGFETAMADIRSALMDARQVAQKAAKRAMTPAKAAGRAKKVVPSKRAPAKKAPAAKRAPAKKATVK